MDLLLMCLEFFKTGLLSVGGGLAPLPFLYSMEDRYPWFDRAQLSDMIAVSESTPGPMGVNMATYAGFTAHGIVGALLATLFLVLPSIIVILIVARFLHRLQTSKGVQQSENCAELQPPCGRIGRNQLEGADPDDRHRRFVPLEAEMAPHHLHCAGCCGRTGTGTMRKILGIDPGFATIGFGLIAADRGSVQMLRYGAITTPAGMDFPQRLQLIYDDMTELLNLLKPDAVSIEELFFNTNITTGIQVAHGRGVILLACTKYGVPIFEYTPLQVKQAVAGYGRAEKRQVMDMTKRLLHLEKIPRPDDAADGLALALCHARSSTSLLSGLERNS